MPTITLAFDLQLIILAPYRIRNEFGLMGVSEIHKGPFKGIHKGSFKGIYKGFKV